MAISNASDFGYVVLEGQTMRETEKAVLINFDDDEQWVPKSLLEDWPDEDCIGDIIVKEWWARQEGFV